MGGCKEIDITKFHNIAPTHLGLDCFLGFFYEITFIGPHDTMSYDDIPMAKVSSLFF
jgi:hypothetical protein